MKRIFLLLLGLGLAVAIGQLGWNLWQTTRYFEENGREATLVIGKRYNAERWSAPVPLKKIHTYTAKLQPKYEVLVESDQELKDGEMRTIRFLTRDVARGLVDYSIRPMANTLRLRGAEDGAPVKIEDTALFDNLVDKWMGPPAKGVYVRPRAVAEAAPSNEKPTVPFVFVDAGDNTWKILWSNSRVQEWLIFGLGLLSVQSLLIAAYDRHKEAGALKKLGKGYVHPSLRKIEADAPESPAKKLTYVPRPDEEIALSDREKRRLAGQAQATTPAADASPSTPPKSSTPSLKFAPAPSTENPVAPTPPAIPAASEAVASPASGANTPAEEPASLLEHETAPPMPIPGDVVLKLRRKSSPGPGSGDGQAKDAGTSGGS